MKYLKKSAEVSIGKAGVQSKEHLSDYTATLALPTYYSDGSGDDLLGIQVTREHLEQLRNEIDRYLSETVESKLEPESIKLVNNFNVGHDLIMACLYPDSSKSRIPDIVQENQRSVNSLQDERTKPLEFDLSKIRSIKTNEGWKATIVYWDGCKTVLSVSGNSESEAKTELYKELIDKLQSQHAYGLSTKNEPEISKQVSTETGDKNSVLFKLNPSRVMSMKVGVEKWEARTKLFSWTSDGLTDLVATAESEEAAREKLDKKFSNFAGSMMSFIKIMS